MKSRIDAILRREQAEYLDSLLPPRDPLLAAMEKFAADENHPIADAEVAQLMQVLLRLKTPRHILEVGTNIGYSVVVMGRECDRGAIVETIELNPQTLHKAKSFVGDAKLECQVIFHEGAALEVISRLSGPFDFVFIDCVKTEYGDYLDQLLPKLQQGALIVCDNLLWKGEVAAAPREGEEPSATALRIFNHRITTDPRLLTSILPMSDGIGLSVVL